MSDFSTDLTELINKYSLENHSNTPDFILAQFLVTALEAFNQGVADREHWYGRADTDVTDLPLKAQKPGAGNMEAQSGPSEDKL